MWIFHTTNSWVCRGQMCAFHAFWCTLKCVLPLSASLPSTGDSKNKWAVYDFQCYSSCVERTGRLRKRRATSATRFPPLRLVLQLVFGPQFEQLGRDGIDIRVCACPGRDRGADADRVKRKGKGKAALVGERIGKHKGKGKAKAAASPPPPQLVPSTGWQGTLCARSNPLHCK